MILDNLKNTVKRYDLIRKHDKILVGVSGGPDSVALIYLLNSLKSTYKISLHIAHLDHMLRKDSSGDRKFVEGLAACLNIPITSEQVDVKKLSGKGSVEEKARNARLNFLSRTAKKIKADKIALGHNLDDQAETVLMRILRGAGLYGLSGILPKRRIAGVDFIRPLLGVKRQEIEAFLKRKKIKAVIDASNQEDIYFRNRIRNKLLPLLAKEYNKNIKEILSNTAESLAFDYDYLNRQAVSKQRIFSHKINLKKLLKLHPAMQRLILRMRIMVLKGDTRRITFQHMRELEDLILNRPVNSIVDLPRGIRVAKEKTALKFYRKK
ncbi:MAG: tRNA lysidine(34) synthetase TilS [Candidatus Omnitrophica bacterium]|nr:tRNA lysidine(34) synthetase TilS [Candidatus Omnitrophota bacterium]